LKGHKGKPPIKPSRMDQEAQGGGEEAEGKERKRGPKRSKTAQLQVVDEVIAPEGLPANARERGWRFKGYADYVVQELVIEVRNVRYRLEEWQGPDGQWLRGKLPASVHGHYGPELVSYVAHQHHHQHVTQPLLLEQLHEFGIEISAGQLSHLLPPADRGSGGFSRREGPGAGGGAASLPSPPDGRHRCPTQWQERLTRTYIGNACFA
jgi:hypothetical protein